MIRMLKIPLITFLFQGIPEIISVCALCYALLRLELVWRKIIPAGVLMATVVYFVRLLPISPGVHTFIITIVLILALRFLTGINYLKIFVVVLSGTALLALLEAASSQVVFLILHISYDEAIKQPVIWTLMGLPQVVSLFMIALLVNRRNREDAFREQVKKDDPSGEIGGCDRRTD